MYITNILPESKADYTRTWRETEAISFNIVREVFPLGIYIIKYMSQGG
jgi:hypothetical protein